MNRNSSLAQLTSRAQSGDPEDLWNLYHALTPQNCTSEVATLALSHLKPGLVPNVSTGEHQRIPHKTYAERALACVTIIAIAGAACVTRPSFAAGTIPRLVRAVDGICLWMGFLLHFGLAYPSTPLPGNDFRKAYYTHCQLLQDMIGTDERLSNAVLSSPTFTNLLLRCWMAKGKGGEVFMKLDLESASACPILNLMILTTENPLGVGILIDQIQVRPRGFSVDFARALIARARFFIQRGTPPTKSIGYLDVILRIAAKFSTSSDSGLRRSFLKVNYLTELALVTNFASIEASKDSHPIELMQHTIGCVMKLSFLIMKQTPRAVHNWRDLVKGDYYALLVRSLAHVAPQDSATEELYTHLLKVFGIYTIYPCMIKLFSTVRIPEASMRMLSMDSRFKAKWETFQAGLRERCHVYDIMPKGFSICDNLSCSRNLKKSPMKQCSRCFSVVYCSEECQQKDWKVRHRTECDLASADNARRRAGGVLYSPTARTFHTFFVEWMYNAHWSELRKAAKQMYPTLSLNQWFIIIRTLEMQFNTGIEPLALLPRRSPHYTAAHGHEEVWWERMKKDVFDQMYLKPRVKEIVGAYKEGRLKVNLGLKGMAEVAVAEGIFQMGTDYSVYLTVPLRRANPNAKWEATYSIARYAFHPDTSGNSL